MQIFFEWELNDNAEQPKNPNNLVYKELREFLTVRYKPLMEEIDAAQNEDEIAFVVFKWHEGGDVELQDFNVPVRLRDKLRGCISESDMDYIINKIGRIIEQENKKN